MKKELLYFALAGVASFSGHSLVEAFSGSYTIGSQVERMRGELQLIRKDITFQNRLFEYRLSQLEEKSQK